MDAKAAREIISTHGTRHTVVVYFRRKSDGTPRRMVCRYMNTPSRTKDTMIVCDIEKGQYRTIPLSRVDDIKLCWGSGRKRSKTWGEVKKEMKRLFG